MTKQEFEQKIKQLCPWTNDKTFALFEIYKQILQEYNKHTNLTRLASDELIYNQYFLASLIPYTKLDYFNEEINMSLLDIGTGSGIPGVVLKIIYPNLKVTLLDSNNKKCIFLKLLLNKLNFNDVDIVNDRCENYAQGHREFFDIITSRAVTDLPKILELSIAFAKINGHIITNKSQNYLDELEIAQKNIQLFKLNKINEQMYIFDNHQYYVTDFIKTEKTSLQYPRSWSQIIKKNKK